VGNAICPGDGIGIQKTAHSGHTVPDLEQGAAYGFPQQPPAGDTVTPHPKKSHIVVVSGDHQLLAGAIKPEVCQSGREHPPELWHPGAAGVGKESEAIIAGNGDLNMRQTTTDVGLSEFSHGDVEKGAAGGDVRAHPIQERVGQ
jgi:hypothetical protein